MIPLDSQTFLGLNQEAYLQLRQALGLNLRRQLLIAVCDNWDLQMQLAQRLAADLSHEAKTATPAGLVTLMLDPRSPDPMGQVVEHFKRRELAGSTTPGAIPAFQVVGVEQLTQQSPAVQNRFLSSLGRTEYVMSRLDLRLLIWLPRPWLRKIRQSVPGFWRLRNGLFDFVGDPTPTPKGGGPVVELPQRPDSGESGPPPQPPEPPAKEESETSAQRPSKAAPSVNVWKILTEDLAAMEQAGQDSPETPGTDSETKASGLTTATVLQADFAPQALDSQTAASSAGRGVAVADSATKSGTLASTITRPMQQLVEADPQLKRLWQHGQALMRQSAGPLTVARAYLSLGQACRDRIEAGNQDPDLLVMAIHAYQQGLPGLWADTSEWCDSWNDLASLYWLRSQTETEPPRMAHWLQQSVHAYCTAVEKPEGQPPDCLARVYSNLGTVYGLLAGLQSPVEHLEKSVRAYHRALQYSPADRRPLEYASLQNSLGAVHWRLAQMGEARHHLHQAIAAYSEALNHRSPQEAPQEFAMIQNNLGIAYWSLAQHERPVFLLQQAIAAYQSALAYRTLATDPAGCAATHNNLGTAFWDLAQHQSESFKQQLALWSQSVSAYEAALEAAQRLLALAPTVTLSFDLWATFHSAGVVHDQLAQHLSEAETDSRTYHLGRALQCYQQALQGWQTQPDRMAMVKSALIHNIRLQYQILGIDGQQSALSQIPGELLPDILPHL